MTVFIHIGFSKTGTTSIQNSLFRNARRLREERSVYYPTYAMKHWAAALPFVEEGKFKLLENRILRGDITREEAWRTADAFRQEFERAAHRYETLIVSSEQLQLLDQQAAEAFRAYFVRLGLSTKVVVYVRHPVERLSSLINQKLRGGEESLESFRSQDSVTPALRTYAEVFGKENLIVRRFGDAYFAGGDLLTDFMAAIGQPPLAGLSGPRQNESLSLPAVLVADELFAMAPLSSGRRGKEPYLLRIAGPKFRACRAMAIEALEVHRQCLEYLEAEFGVRFDAVDLASFPERIEREISAETLSSIARVLHEQSHTIDELRSELDRLRSADEGRKYRRNQGRVGRLLAQFRTGWFAPKRAERPEKSEAPPS